MHINMQKEEFSRAFVQAIAAQVGCKHIQESVDDSSIDMTLTMDGIQGQDALLSSVDLKLQLKCTSQDIGHNNILTFNLNKKNYDDLRVTNILVPRILVVVCVPENIEEWIYHDSEKICLFRSAYWYSLRNASESNNSTSIAIKIPLNQRFDADFLNSAMHKIARGEFL